jgi:hypothetical protein
MMQLMTDALMRTTSRQAVAPMWTCGVGTDGEPKNLPTMVMGVRLPSRFVPGPSHAARP